MRRRGQDTLVKKLRLSGQSCISGQARLSLVCLPNGFKLFSDKKRNVNRIEFRFYMKNITKIYKMQI